MSVLPEQLVHNGPWSEAEFFALPSEWRRAELLDGELLVSPSPTNRHQRLSSRLWLALERARPAELEALEAVNVRLGPVRILIPDIAVVVRIAAEVAAYDAADVRLVVEIVSRGSVATDRAVKPRLYAEAGIGHYVRVEPDGPTAHCYRLDRDRYVLVESGPILRLVDPFPAEVDLPALMAADRVE